MFWFWILIKLFVDDYKDLHGNSAGGRDGGQQTDTRLHGPADSH